MEVKISKQDITADFTAGDGRASYSMPNFAGIKPGKATADEFRRTAAETANAAKKDRAAAAAKAATDARAQRIEALIQAGLSVDAAELLA